jgi:hypothetical protein
MSRVKLVMLSLLATFALSAVASSTALATHEFLVNGKAIAKGEKVEVQGNVIAEGTETTIAKLPVHMACVEGAVPPGTTNVLEEAGKFKTKVEYKTCGVVTVSGGIAEDQPKCKVPGFITEGSGELTEAGVVSIKGTPFATVRIEEVAGAGACALTGEYKVEGTQLCAIPDYSLTGYIGPIVCDPTGSKELKLGGEVLKVFSTTGIYATKGQTLSSN